MNLPSGCSSTWISTAPCGPGQLRRGEFQEASSAARLLPDGFDRAVALAGDAQEAAERICGVLRAGADSVHVFPLGRDRMATVRAFAHMMNATTKEREGSGASSA